ncbi:MAG: DmsC/YnfH family molybdoenzyme membrane anchor subunit [Nitrospiria bacterium]
MNKTETVFPLKSKHGTEIALDQSHPELAETPLEINGRALSPGTAENPNRYKQHGFHFNADNCIACHACESACSEKNDLAPHMAYRRVGSIEGGCYPDVTRINISMACNHCEDPVCLKGCPTRAYTKYLEYGAVLQDPEICFGCGYCTWVCPYNAPQLDTEKGQVQKCNMCIDRLEVGLQPACVDACLGNALNFGVIEEIPQKQEEASLKIPSFTDPGISRPNIRFQLKRPLPDGFQRMDDAPLRYEADAEKRYQVKETAPAFTEGWGWDKLRSREDPLVLFTLISQFVVGTFLMFFLLPKVNGAAEGLFSFEHHPMAMASSLFTLAVLQTFALVLSTLHLGKPRYFYRAMNNLRHSWVSREIAAMGAFYALLLAYGVVTVFPVLSAWLPDVVSEPLPDWIGGVASAFGPAGLYAMYRCYRIPARPFWDHWHTGASFAASALILGSGAIGLLFGAASLGAGVDVAPLLRLIALIFMIGLGLQHAAQFVHLRDLRRRGGEAAVSRMLMMKTHGKIFRARRISGALLAAASIGFSLFPPTAVGSVVLWAVVFFLALIHEMVGRALFYVSVVPTTVPRAFFWGNHIFEDLARTSGLAERPQTGVLMRDH